MRLSNLLDRPPFHSIRIQKKYIFWNVSQGRGPFRAQDYYFKNANLSLVHVNQKYVFAD